MQNRLRYRAHFELTGVPAHAWNRTTATTVLSSDAWVECLGVATANLEDLGRFHVVAWTNNLSVFPKAKELLIEEPDDLMEEDEGLVLPGSALIPLEKTMLRYNISVRVAHAEDMIPVDDESDGGDSTDGDGGDGGSGRRQDREDDPGRRRSSRDGRDVRRDERGRDHDRDDRRRSSRSRRRDALRRRPSGGGGWGGSRRVALNTAAEISPWPEVEDDDVDGVVEDMGCMRLVGPAAESSPRLVGVRETVVHLQGSGERWPPASDPLLRGGGGAGASSPRGKEGPDASDPLPRGRGGANGNSPRGEEGPGAVDIRGRCSSEGPGSVSKVVEAPTEILEASEWATPRPTRVEVVEEEWEEGECRFGPFHVVVKGPVLPSMTGLDHVQNCQLSNSGILHTPSLQGWTSPEEFVGSVDGGLPRSVLEYFRVSVSPADKGLQLGTAAVESASLGMGQDFAYFRDSCRRPISPVLSRPARQCRKKKVYTGPVRRSGRISKRFAAGTPIRQQQRALITRLGIAREGDVIGDEAFDAYLDLFTRPFRQQHLDVVLRLFGWTPDDLQAASDAPVECLS
ncbi:hypothetical protein ACQ4PT_031366 [Festuca glaucescens]